MKNKLIDSYKMVSSHEGTLFIYAFAYALIVGIAPLLIILVLIASNLVLDIDSMVSILSLYIPTDLITPFINYIIEIAPQDIILLLSLSFVSFWVASKSIYSFLLETSRIEDVKSQAAIVRVISVIYFMIIILGGSLVIALLRYLPPYNYITLPLILWLLMMVFYRMISFKFSEFIDVYMGSAIATAGLIVLGKLFFIYVNDFSNYQSIYGPLASFMILLISVYFISYIIYLGFCVNVQFYKEREDDTIKRKLIYRISEWNYMAWLFKRD